MTTMRRVRKDNGRWGWVRDRDGQPVVTRQLDMSDQAARAIRIQALMDESSTSAVVEAAIRAYLARGHALAKAALRAS